MHAFVHFECEPAIQEEQAYFAKAPLRYCILEMVHALNFKNITERKVQEEW